MQHYVGRSKLYVWPESLRQPARPPKLVYLDLNHWIALSKALARHPDGDGSREVLAGCLSALERGTAIFPISDSIYLEISKNRVYRQRRDLREVIETLSRFKVVASRSVVSFHEIEALLDRIVGPSPNPLNPLRYLDWGVARAFGMIGGFKVRSGTGEDVTREVRDSHPDGPDAFDLILAEGELELNRRVIDGPAPGAEAGLRQAGWDPTPMFEIAKRRAAQEVEQVNRFDQHPQWRRGRTRDVVAAREVLIEINEALSKGLRERGATLESVFSRVNGTRTALDSMPSFDVAVTLKTGYHRDAMHRWTPNDIHDIDAMGSTLPYCDIVVTDNAVASHVKRNQLAGRLDTIVLSQLSALAQYL